MAEISEDELEAIQEGFDTYSLLGAIDQLDVIRGHLGPSELRENLLKLHGLAMEVINFSARGERVTMPRPTSRFLAITANGFSLRNFRSRRAAFAVALNASQTR